MNHKHKRHRTVSRFQKKFRNIAAAVVGAVMLSGAMLPGVPAATAHASAADPSAGSSPVEASQQVSKTDKAKGPVQVNLDKGTAKVKNQKQTRSAKHTKKPAQQNNKQAENAKKSGNSKKTPDNYEKVLNIKATAYAPGPHDNDQWGNKTFTGEQIRPGVIAVDPNVIPLGSKVYIQYPDGHGEYAVASDTGGAIKGNRIDVAKWTVGEAQDFGIQNVKVFVVDTPENNA